MAKYYGIIGYGVTTETSPGVYTAEIVERASYGDTVRLTRRSEPTEHLNDNIVLNESLSILADPFSIGNFMNIKYATLFGQKIKVTSVEVAYPRLILELGSLWTEETIE